MNKQVELARADLKASETGHVDQAAPERAPGYVLLPGDPNRVEKMAAQWDGDTQFYNLSRGQRAAVGAYRGAELGAWSTGIGGASTECVLTDLAARGTHTFIRVGTTDGTSRLYVRDEYPAAASYEVVLALVQACENLGLRYHVGTGCTCASFYTGQCRTSYNGYRPSHLDSLFADLRQAGVLNFEMEGATVTTLGMCASVVAQRITGEWDETPEGERNACLAGAEAIRILTEWDRKKAKQGKRYYFPGL